VESSAAEAIRENFVFLTAVGAADFPNEHLAAPFLGWGWWVRTVRTAEAIRLISQEGMAHEAAPLTRTVIHHGLALSWLAREPDRVLEAVRYQHLQKGQKLVEGALRRQWDLSKADEFPKKPEGSPPSGVAYLESVEKLCELVGAPNTYVAFMAESSYVHPSAVGADAYFSHDGASGPATFAAVGGTSLRSVAVFAGLATVAMSGLARLEGVEVLIGMLESKLGLSLASLESEVGEAPHLDPAHGLLRERP
jgi:hypothetical protein